ncbi:MAG: helix-turn-helix domain-containing protein [Acidimicrobiales bacterium]|jgi:y4mF family transcriptional regulator
MKINSMRDFAATVRGRRHDLRLSQAGLASRAGVSREWISGLEAGKATVEFGLVIRLLEALGLGFDVVVRDTASDAAAVDLDALLEEHRGQ